MYLLQLISQLTENSVFQTDFGWPAISECLTVCDNNDILDSLALGWGGGKGAALVLDKPIVAMPIAHSCTEVIADLFDVLTMGIPY